MPEAWESQLARTRRSARTSKKLFRGDAGGRLSTPTPVDVPSRVQRPNGGTFTVYVQPDEPEGVTEIGALWFDTDEPVPD